jgi:hypothetical protein
MTLKSPMRGHMNFTGSIRSMISNKSNKSAKSTASTGSGNSATSQTSSSNNNNNIHHPSTPLTAKYSNGSTSTASTVQSNGSSGLSIASKSAPGRSNTKSKSSSSDNHQQLGKIPLPLYSDFPKGAPVPQSPRTGKKKGAVTSGSVTSPTKSVKLPSKASATLALPSRSPKVKGKLKAKKAGGSGGIKKAKPDKKKQTKKKKTVAVKADAVPSLLTSYDDDPDGNVERSRSFVFHQRYSSGSEEEVEPDDDDDSRDDDSDNDLGMAVKRGGRPTPERTWSIGAFSAAQSVGDNTIQTTLYVEDGSSYSEFDDDSDDDSDYNNESLLSPKKKKKKKGKRTEVAVRRMTKKQREKQRMAEQRAAAALRAMSQSPIKGGTNNASNVAVEVNRNNIPESPKSAANQHVDITSPSNGSKKKKGKKKAKAVATKPRKQFPPLDEITLDSGEFDDDGTEGGGYNSDGALSRKKNLLRQKNSKNRGGKKNKKPNNVIIDFEYEDIAKHHPSENHTGKRMERRNSTGTLGSTVAEKKNKKLQKKDAIAALRAAAAAAEKEAAARAAAAESDEEYLMDEEQLPPESMASLPMSSSNNLFESFSSDLKGGSKAGKDDAMKKMQELDDYFKEVDKSTPDLLQGDYGCNMSVATGKSGLEALEKLLHNGQHDALQKEREAIAFERESLELQLSDELQKNEELTMQILELEQQLQSQQYSNANEFRGQQDWEKEKEDLKATFEGEKNELSQRLLEKDREIQDLERTVKDFEMLQEKSGLLSEDSEGKSKERLQGELLQTIAKLSQKESRLQQQSEELEQIKAEMAELALGAGVEAFREEIKCLKDEKRQMEENWKAEKKDCDAKLKDKDDTITYLMGELARLKQEQSQATGSIGGILYPNQSLGNSSNHSSISETSMSRRGSSLFSTLGFSSSNVQKD